MEKGFFIALGVAVIFGFLLYAVKAMPRSLAWTGIAAGVALMVLDIANLRLYAWPTVVAFVGIFCLAGAGLWAERIYKDSIKASEVTAKGAEATEPKRETPKVAEQPRLVAEWKMFGNIQPTTTLPWVTVIIRKEPNGDITYNSYQSMSLQNVGFIPPAPHGFLTGLCQIINLWKRPYIQYPHGI